MITLTYIYAVCETVFRMTRYDPYNAFWIDIAPVPLPIMQFPMAYVKGLM